MNQAKRLARAKVKAKGMNYARHYGENEGTALPFMRIGNRDWGCPFRGRDRFSGQWKKFTDRSYQERKSTGEIVTILLPFDNNKYNVRGGLKGA